MKLIHNDFDKLAKLFLKNGSEALILKKDEFGRTVLHYAARFKRENCIKVLCKKEKLVASSDNDELSPLDMSAIVGYKKGIEMILSQVPYEWTEEKFSKVWCCASFSQSTELLDYLIQLKNNQKSNSFHLKLTNQFSDTLKSICLHFAAANQQPLPNLEYLLKFPQLKEIVNSPDKTGKTPLHIAALYRNSFFCKILLSAGSQLEVFDNQEFTPIHYAISIQNLMTLKVLLGIKEITSLFYTFFVNKPNGDKINFFEFCCKKKKFLILQEILFYVQKESSKLHCSFLCNSQKQVNFLSFYSMR